MKFSQLAIVAGAFPYAALPKTIELDAAFADAIRAAGQQSVIQSGEASMVLVKDMKRGSIEFRHLDVQKDAHAEPQINLVHSPSVVIGTVHTHPVDSAVATLSPGLAGMMGAHGNEAVGRQVGPLAYSPADVVGMAGSMNVPTKEEAFCSSYLKRCIF
jgi:hypothetical protein